MKIGLFTDTFLPEINGVVTVIQMMERKLTREGHEVHIFAPAYPGRHGNPTRVHRFPSLRFIFYPGMRMAIPYNRRALEVIPSLNLIHSHDPGPIGLLALWASKRYQIPHVHTYHTFYAQYRYYLPLPVRPSRGIVIRLSRAFCNRCDAVIAPSLQMKRELESYGIKSLIYPLPFGVDENEFSHEIEWNVRAKLNLPTEDLLLYAGRLGIEKNLIFLLCAFKRLPDNFWEPIICNSKVTLADLFASNIGDFLVVATTEPSLKCKVAGDNIITAEKALEMVSIILTAHGRYYVGARILIRVHSHNNTQFLPFRLRV